MLGLLVQIKNNPYTVATAASSAHLLHDLVVDHQQVPGNLGHNPCNIDHNPGRIGECERFESGFLLQIKDNAGIGGSGPIANICQIICTRRTGNSGAAP